MANSYVTDHALASRLEFAEAKANVASIEARRAADPEVGAAWIERETNDAPRELTLIGSSLGGYYATHLAERYGARAAMINPSIRPYDTLRAYAGQQVNLHSGETFDVTEAHFAALAAMRVARITRPDRYFLLVRTGDEVLDWRESVAHYGGAWQYVGGGGDHGWVDFDDQVAPVLHFAGCQE